MSDLPADTLTTTIANHLGCRAGSLVATHSSPPFVLCESTAHAQALWGHNGCEFTADLAAAVVSVLATHNEHTAADAWDEGWQAAWSPMSMHNRDDGPNPYRLAAVSPTPPTHKEKA